MSRAWKESEAFSGTGGEAWINNIYVAEIEGLDANIELEFEDVNKPRKLGKGKKLISYEGEGTVKLTKISSRFSKMILDNLKEGKETKVKLVSNLEDPAAKGNERIAIYDATFTNIPFSWNTKEVVKEEFNFWFTKTDYIDYVDY